MTTCQLSPLMLQVILLLTSFSTSNPSLLFGTFSALFSFQSPLHLRICILLYNIPHHTPSSFPQCMFSPIYNEKSILPRVIYSHILPTSAHSLLYHQNDSQELSYILHLLNLLLSAHSHSSGFYSIRSS